MLLPLVKASGSGGIKLRVGVLVPVGAPAVWLGSSLVIGATGGLGGRVGVPGGCRGGTAYLWGWGLGWRSVAAWIVQSCWRGRGGSVCRWGEGGSSTTAAAVVVVVGRGGGYRTGEVVSVIE